MNKEAELFRVSRISPRLTIAQAIHNGIQQLQTTSDTPKLDSEILLLYALNHISDADSLAPKTRTWLLTWPEALLSAGQLHAFQQSLDIRIRGMPIAYITSAQGFWAFDLEVTPDTLIPRPETELLVECTLEKIPDSPATKASSMSVLELGTGSGAIALALAYERPASHIMASDISIKALEVAQRNARQLELNNIDFIHSCWFESITHREYNLIVSNPPYIPQTDPHLQQTCLQYEPQLALRSGPDGLDALKIIIHQSPDYLKTDGWLILEHGYDQKHAVQSLLRKGPFSRILTVHDLNNQPRVSMAQMCHF